MIRQTTEEVLPVAHLPESEALRIRIVVAHRRVSIWSAVKVKLDELLEVRPDNLVGIDENDLLQVHRKEHVEEQDLVRPDDALLLLLCTEPRWPLVRDELILAAVLCCEVRDKLLHLG